MKQGEIPKGSNPEVEAILDDFAREDYERRVGLSRRLERKSKRAVGPVRRSGPNRRGLFDGIDLDADDYAAFHWDIGDK